MLYLIAVWLVLGTVCSAVGLALLNLLSANCFARISDRLVVAIWLSLLVSANVLLGLSTLLPLSPAIGAVIFLGFGMFALLQPATRAELQKLRFSRGGIVTIASVTIAIAAVCSRQVTWIDTGLYHYSVVQWLAQYGSVPGVALLFANFGFTSAWFALAAPFDFGVFTARASAVANGFVLLIALGQWFWAARSIWQRQAQLSDWFAIAFLSLLIPLVLVSDLLSDILVSPSPDIAALLITGIVAWAILVILGDRVAPTDRQFTDRRASSTVVLLLAAGAVSVKLTLLTLLLVAGCFWLVNSWRQPLAGSAAIALLVPLLTSSIITSGCPLYPSTAMCLDLPWSPTALVRSQVAAGTHQWTSWYGESAAGVRGVVWALWQWFSLSKTNQLLLLLIIVSLLAIGIVLKKIKLDRQPGLLWVAAIGGTGIGFLLLTSPMLRFALAYVLLVPALLLALWGQKWSAKIQFKGCPQQAVWLCPLLATIVTVTSLHSQVDRLLLPPPIQRVRVEERQLNNFRYFSPISDLCWATALPCAFKVTPDIELRDPQRGLRAGFRRR
ncbi:hypothetical protein H6F67_20370 [Microcoleus sp. FACHB-1515]|uniref:LIC_10190 family membrane protein n=1 Tax=Cyanophyceae TaxID=3028117 RepID=UPI00168382BB|nr:hypothetical protein [Microcoleus sp. FACHB-1515]MBD2092209.1 hypothetical protein [Microcoleus sp. FACHB-1515]